IAALEQLKNPTQAPQAAPPEQDVAGLPSNRTLPGVDGKPRAPTLHADGKWYFELTIDRAEVARLGAVLIIAGFAEVDGMMTANMSNIREGDLGTQVVGCAIDLDNGAVYFREDGTWGNDEPGSNRGADVKLGRNYSAQVRSSIDTQRLI